MKPNPPVSRTARSARTLLPALLALAAAIAPALADEATVTADPADFARADGAAVYAHICQGCHMADGHGAAQVGRYPGFADNPALLSPQYVALTVMNGRKNMPAFGIRREQAETMRGVALSDEQIAEVTNYLRSHFGNHYDDRIDAADVAALRQAAAPPKTTASR